jgi:hypothetical protein
MMMSILVVVEAVSMLFLLQLWVPFVSAQLQPLIRHCAEDPL